jgi:AcrR family transcriptional regulator
MTSDCHTRSAEDRYLDAARACLLAVGWRRTTLTDVARRADVSRMTIYRRWPDMQALLADLMTREWGEVVAAVTDPGPRGAVPGSAREEIARGVRHGVAALRENQLLRTIVEVDPELLLPYLLDRRGRSQDHILGLLVPMIQRGQAEGAVRRGDPTLLARAVLLAAHGFTLSVQTMADPERPVSGYDEQVQVLVERYLAP